MFVRIILFIVLAFFTLCFLYVHIEEFRDEMKNKKNSKLINRVSSYFGFVKDIGYFLLLLSIVGIPSYFIAAAIDHANFPLFSVFEGGNNQSDNYDYPGLDNPEIDTDDSPGIHEVNGHYRGNGTYVEPYMRSDPDDSTSNNLNP